MQGFLDLILHITANQPSLFHPVYHQPFLNVSVPAGNKQDIKHLTDTENYLSKTFIQKKIATI